MNRLHRIGVVAALATVSALAVSQGAGPPSPEARAKGAVETRQGLFKVISSQFGPVAAGLRGQGDIDAAVAAEKAARIQTLAEIIPELFALDTREFKDIKTRALDGIWNSQADFKAKADGLSQAAAALVAASKSGNQEAIRKAAMEVGTKGCSPCHDNYRAK